MKATLLILITLFIVTRSFTQKLSEDTLHGNPYYLSVVEGEYKGKLTNVYILEVLPKMDKYRMVRALYCKDNSLAFNSYNTPETCVEWVPYDESQDKVTKVDENGNRTEVRSDSSKQINKDCLNDFYAENNEMVQVDTIYVKNKYLAYSTVYYISKCAYVNNMKQGKEVVYYELWELTGDCIETKDRIKMSGSWDKGRKTGEWKYFNVNGQLVTTEFYKKGKLKKVTHHNDQHE